MHRLLSSCSLLCSHVNNWYDVKHPKESCIGLDASARVDLWHAQVVEQIQLTVFVSRTVGSPYSVCYLGPWVPDIDKQSQMSSA
jgi:hypothetical protein